MSEETAPDRVKFWFKSPALLPKFLTEIGYAHLGFWLCGPFLLLLRWLLYHLFWLDPISIPSTGEGLHLGLLAIWLLGVVGYALKHMGMVWPKKLKHPHAILLFLTGFGLGSLLGGVLLLWRWGTEGTLPPWWHGIAWSLVLGSLGVSLAEELVFRGGLLFGLSRCYPAFWAIQLQSLCFAAAHFARWGVPPDAVWQQGIGLWLVGVFLGLLTWQRQSIWPAIGVHSCWIMLAHAWAAWPTMAPGMGGGDFLTAIPLTQILLLGGSLWLYRYLPFRESHPQI